MLKNKCTKSLILATLLFLNASWGPNSGNQGLRWGSQNAPTDISATAHNFFEFTYPTLDATPLFMRNFIDRVILVVIVDHPSTFSDQLADFEKLAKSFPTSELTIVAIPTTSLNAKSLSNGLQWKKDVVTKLKLSYPFLAVSRVESGANNQLIDFLTTSGPEKTRGPVKESFTKFLIGRRGFVVQRFSAKTKPLSKELVQAIKKQTKIFK